MLTVEEIRAGLAQPGKSQKGLAAALGVDNSQISRLLAGKRSLRVHEVPLILAYLESNAAGPIIRGKTAMPEVVQIGGDRFAMLPVYDTAASAGPGVEAEDAAPVYRLAFRADWLRRVTRADLSQLAVITVDGDSMEPTLRQGDNVLVDLSQNRPGRKDGIYVLRTEGGLQVKRVAVHPITGRVTIISDNREYYPSFTDLAPEGIAVLGRVIWLGRQIGV
ncbi:MAG: helix-turn-helix transcriptional regulator [Roseomonas sp.]|nr:helix-turn-helix transcriptional regulator [Roseomonas sp.]